MANDKREALAERLIMWADAIDLQASDCDFPGGHLGFWREVEDVLREAAALCIPEPGSQAEDELMLRACRVLIAAGRSSFDAPSARAALRALRGQTDE